MFYSVPISSNIITHSPIEAKSITHVFFINKNDKIFQWKEELDTISISIDGKQIARNILVFPFMTSTSCGRGQFDWKDVALEVGLNVNMSEIKITSNSNDNDYAVVFVCNDKDISETGVDYVEWRKFTISKQLGGQQLQALVNDLITNAEQTVRNRIVTRQSEAVSEWQRYLDYLQNRDYIRKAYFNDNKTQDENRQYISSISYYVEKFLGLYDETTWVNDILKIEIPVCNLGNDVQDAYDSAIKTYHWYNSILLPAIDKRAYTSIDHYFESFFEDNWSTTKPSDWDEIITKISSLPQYFLTDEEIAIADSSENAPNFDVSSESFLELCTYWINPNDNYLLFGFEKPIFRTYAEYDYCGAPSIYTVDNMYKKARNESSAPKDEYIGDLFGEKILIREATNDYSERSRWVYPLCENYVVGTEKVDCLTYYTRHYSMFSPLGKRTNIGFNTEYQIMLDYAPRQFFCASQCSKIIDINYNKSESQTCPNLTSFTLLCGDNVDIPSDMDMSIVSISENIPMRKALYDIDNSNRGVSFTMRNIDQHNGEEHDDWNIYIIFISKRLI